MSYQRFFHVRTKGAPKGGATVCVIGEREGTIEDDVYVSVAYCSPNDQFCRKTGRLLSTEHQGRYIPLKDLPGFLHKVSREVLRRQKGQFSVINRNMTELWNRDWSFSTKYWLTVDAGKPLHRIGEGTARHGLMRIRPDVVPG